MASKAGSRVRQLLAVALSGLAAHLTGETVGLTLAKVRQRARELQSHILGKTDCRLDATFQSCISPYVHQLSALIRGHTVWKLNDTAGTRTSSLRTFGV